MALTKEQKARIERIYGNGVDSDRGGGMPLPFVFSTLLERLLDNGPADVSALAEITEERVKKRERVKMIYNTTHEMRGDPYRLFITDVVEQMQDSELVSISEGNVVSLHLQPEGAFATHTPLRISKQRDSKKGYVILPAQEREKIGRIAHQEAEISALANDLKPDGPGLRPLDPEIIQTLTDSITESGFLEAFPILVDQDDHIIDGRHRDAVLKKLGLPGKRRSIKVINDREAILLAYTANLTAAFKKNELKALQKRLIAAGITVSEITRALHNKDKQEIIKAELLRNPMRSDRLIAEAVEAQGGGFKPSPMSVLTIRHELEEDEIVQLGQFRGAAGRGKRDVAATKREPSPEAVERDEKISKLHDEGATVNKIAEETGSPANTVRRKVEAIDIKEEGRREGRAEILALFGIEYTDPLTKEKAETLVNQYRAKHVVLQPHHRSQQLSRLLLG